VATIVIAGAGFVGLGFYEEKEHKYVELKKEHKSLRKQLDWESSSSDEEPNPVKAQEIIKMDTFVVRQDLDYGTLIK